MNTIWKFFDYNKKLASIVGSKVGLFIILFAIVLLVQTINLAQLKFLFVIIKVAIDTAVNLLILFILLYPGKSFDSSTLSHLKNFIYQRYLPVLGCLLVMFIVISFGMLLLILPGLLAFFFFHFAYLYVALENESIKNSFVRSMNLAKNIAPLNMLIFIVYALVVLVIWMSSALYMQGVFASIATIYLAALKAIVFLDNYKKA